MSDKDKTKRPATDAYTALAALGMEDPRGAKATMSSASAPARATKGAMPKIPSYDTGTALVPEDQLAQLHAGEAVIPADENPNNTDKTALILTANDTETGLGSAAPSQDVLKPFGSEHVAQEVDRGDVKMPGKSIGFGTAAPIPTELSAIQDKKDEAASKGDLVGLGSALINEKIALPKYTGPNAIRSVAPAPGELIAPAAEKTDEDLYARPTSSDELNARKNELKATIANAEATGDHARAGNAKVALAELEKQTPWGSALNHPGLLGKIGHIASEVGNIAGDVVAPGTMELIPGTQLNKNLKESNAFGEIGFANDQDLKSAQAEHEREIASAAARDSKLAAQLMTKGYILSKNATGEPVLTQVPGFRDAPKDAKETYAAAVASALQNNPTVDPTQDPAVQAALKGLQAEQKANQPNSEANKEKAQAVVSKVAAAGFPTDAPNLNTSITKAEKAGKITPQEAADLRGYQAVNPNAATSLNLNLAEGNAAEDRHLAGKQVLVNGQQMSWADAKTVGYTPADVESIPATMAKLNTDKLSSANAYAKVLGKYQTEFDDNVDKLTDKDRAALGVLTAHTSETAGAIGGLLEGINPGIVTDIMLGQPMTGYSQKLMGASMTKDQYAALSPAGKKLVSDYFTAIVGNFADMKNQLGSVGRNAMQLQAEINTIPLPYLDKESANDQFSNKIDDLKNRYASLVRIKGQAYPFEGSNNQQQHVISYQGKQYRYKGSGPTDDIKNYTEIK